MTTKEDFIKEYGYEPLSVTPNFMTKSIGTNYRIQDAFVEFCDNAFDAKIEGTILNFSIEKYEEKHQIIIIDDGVGIENPDDLLKLGGTNKESLDKIGKYGIGVPGALSTIATKCIYNTNDNVFIIYESAHNGKKFIKNIMITPNGETYIGSTKYSDCDINEHYTKILFDNVTIENYYGDIIDALDEEYEMPLHDNTVNISCNGRRLGRSGKRTFIGDEKAEVVKVGDYNVSIKYRIISGDNNDERALDESGLRVYDSNSGRLLAKDNNLWKCYANRSAQQNICGLRCGMWIDSSIDSYKMFGIKPQKNGIEKDDYFKKPCFKELKDKLGSIYARASNRVFTPKDTEFTIKGKSFSTNSKLKEVYTVVNDSVIIMKKKLTLQEQAELINENIELKKKLEKKIKLKKIA